MSLINKIGGDISIFFFECETSYLHLTLTLFLSWSMKKKMKKLYTPLSFWSLFHIKDVIISTKVEHMIL